MNRMECNAARIPVLQQEEGRPSLCTLRARRGQSRQPTIVLGDDTERRLSIPSAQRSDPYLETTLRLTSLRPRQRESVYHSWTLLNKVSMSVILHLSPSFDSA